MNNQKCQTCSESILVLSGQIDRLGTLNKPSILHLRWYKKYVQQRYCRFRLYTMTGIYILVIPTLPVMTQTVYVGNTNMHAISRTQLSMLVWQAVRAWTPKPPSAEYVQTVNGLRKCEVHGNKRCPYTDAHQFHALNQVHILWQTVSLQMHCMCTESDFYVRLKALLTNIFVIACNCY